MAVTRAGATTRRTNERSIVLHVSSDALLSPGGWTALQDAASHLQVLLNQLGKSDMEQLSVSLASLEHGTKPAPRKRSLVSTLTDGTHYSLSDRVELALWSTAAAFQRRRELLSDAYTAPAVAKLLGVSRQNPHDRLAAKTLLGVRDDGVWKFPAWQFDPDGPDGVIAHLPDVLRALRVTDLAKVAWLTMPNGELAGKTPLNALRQGEREQVVAMAGTVGQL